MKTNQLILGTMALVASVGAFGCSFAKRSPEMYSDDTRKLLMTKSDEMKSCYDTYLKGDKTAAGSITVFFVVEKETGKIKDAEVKDATAPEPLKDCVTQSIVGLTLDPPDADDGHATFTFEFQPAG